MAVNKTHGIYKAGVNLASDTENEEHKETI